TVLPRGLESTLVSIEGLRAIRNRRIAAGSKVASQNRRVVAACLDAPVDAGIEQESVTQVIVELHFAGPQPVRAVVGVEVRRARPQEVIQERPLIDREVIEGLEESYFRVEIFLFADCAQSDDRRQLAGDVVLALAENTVRVRLEPGDRSDIHRLDGGARDAVD